jgi:hypothetical protein
MKYLTYAIVAIAASLAVGCNKQKASIDEAENATQESIDMRKDNVDANAKSATEQTERNAKIDKATIEADRESIQAQLDADKKKAKAEGALIAWQGCADGYYLCRAFSLMRYDIDLHRGGGFSFSNWIDTIPYS